MTDRTAGPAAGARLPHQAVTTSRWRTTTLGAAVLALTLTLVPAGAVVADEPGATPSAPVEQPTMRTAAVSDAARDSRLVVLWEDHADEATRAAVLDDIGERGSRVGRLDTVTIDDARPDELAAIARQLSARDDVAAAEPDRVIHLAQSHGDGQDGDPDDTGQARIEPPTRAERPDDPLYPEQWGLENVGQLLLSDGSRSTAGVDVRAREAWAITEGNPSVTVAVIDSGIDVTHRDLTDAIWTNPGEVADGRDSDGNGFVDDVNGFDFVTGRPIVVAEPSGVVRESHGTQVAGVLAARSRNATGIAGIAPQVSVMPVRAFQQVTDDGAGSSDLHTIVAAINYAVDNGADVINASWESPAVSSVLERAVADAGIPVVAASGNRGLNLAVVGTAVPASYLLPNLVAVTAIGPRGGLPSFANVGANTIDLGAPGVGIVTTTVDDRFRTLADGGAQGTSFAAPFVAGALALGLSVEPTRSTGELIDTLLRTTTARSSLATTTTSGGSLDVGAFLAGLAQPVCGRADLPLAGFSDVNPTSTHARSIDCIADAAVTGGFTDGTYRPGATVTRGQMASFLAGIVDAAGQLPSDAPDAFTDDDGSVHEENINALAVLGIITGDGDDRVRPADEVTRGQLASLLVRTHAVLEDRDRTPTRAWFPDAADSVHRDTISIARDLGLVRGRDRVFYDVVSATRRDQMASTLARMLDSLAREDVALTVG